MMKNNLIYSLGIESLGIENNLIYSLGIESLGIEDNLTDIIRDEEQSKMKYSKPTLGNWRQFNRHY